MLCFHDSMSMLICFGVILVFEKLYYLIIINISHNYFNLFLYIQIPLYKYFIKKLHFCNLYIYILNVLGIIIKISFILLSMLFFSFKLHQVFIYNGKKIVEEDIVLFFFASHKPCIHTYTYIYMTKYVTKSNLIKIQSLISFKKKTIKHNNLHDGTIITFIKNMQKLNMKEL